MKTSVIRICFYGPESTGKSTLATKMAEKYHTEFVPEVAREMVTSNQFTEEDIIRIGKEQVKRILEKTTTANRILFCDTDLITTQIYSDVYLKKVPSVLLELEKQTPMDHYFLFDIDVPWVADGLRDLGAKRQQMMEIFKENLSSRRIPYILLRGAYEKRENQVVQFVDRLFATG